MAYSLLSTGIDDLEDHQEYAAYLSPLSTTFEHNSTCFVFSPKTREIAIEFVRLAERHHRAIRNLKLDIRSDGSKA
jgi:hypothetical protein